MTFGSMTNDPGSGPAWYPGGLGPAADDLFAPVDAPFPTAPVSAAPAVAPVAAAHGPALARHHSLPNHPQVPPQALAHAHPHAHAHAQMAAPLHHHRQPNLPGPTAPAASMAAVAAAPPQPPPPQQPPHQQPAHPQHLAQQPPAHAHADTAGSASHSPPQAPNYQHMTVPELLDGIDPAFMDDIRVGAPDLLQALMRQTPTSPAQPPAPAAPAPAPAAAPPAPVPDPAADIFASPLAPAGPTMHDFPAPTSTHPHPHHPPPAAAAAAQRQTSSARGRPFSAPTQGRPHVPAAPVAMSSAAAAVAAVQPPQAPAQTQHQQAQPPKPAVKREAPPTSPGAMSGVTSGLAGPPKVSGEASMGDDDAAQPEARKQMRAERNRQSAAASRERKKHHIKELERRVAMLSAENAQLQVEQLQHIKERIDKERVFKEENKRLQKQVVFQDMKIEKLTRQIEEAGIGDQKETLRRKTWDATQWATKKRAA